ncbi:thioredoxin domain-containing protein [Candidatus Gottesmanbacteria bacterium]|nr:thioredoxin domain-containing protein [Candidatus Gottesmanbacteria bacterium]
MNLPQPIPKKSNSILVPTLVIAVIVLSFLAGSLWQKVKILETGGVAGAAVKNHLSVDNLKKYAKDLKLNTKEFNSCLDDSEKKDLVLAELSEGESFGIQGTPGFFMNGHLIPGALPFDIFKQVIDYELSTGFDSGKTLTAEIKNLVDQGYVSANKLQVNIGSSPSTGLDNAPITLIEYSDFECPYCIRAYPTVKEVLKQYGDKIKFSYKNFPLSSIHPNAQKAAEAAACASEQGKFWEYHDKLFESATS